MILLLNNILIAGDAGYRGRGRRGRGGPATRPEEVQGQRLRGGTRGRAGHRHQSEKDTERTSLLRRGGCAHGTGVTAVRGSHIVRQGVAEDGASAGLGGRGAPVPENPREDSLGGGRGRPRGAHTGRRAPGYRRGNLADGESAAVRGRGERGGRGGGPGRGGPGRQPREGEYTASRGRGGTDRGRAERGGRHPEDVADAESSEVRRRGGRGSERGGRGGERGGERGGRDGERGGRRSEEDTPAGRGRGRGRGGRGGRGAAVDGASDKGIGCLSLFGLHRKSDQIKVQ